MRQESINTFSEGLNYDLNPLVTPNNTLTDTLNGTYLTYNGNELSLQNDAGNITINISKSGNTVPTYNPNEDYEVDNLVAQTDDKNRLRYYICLLDNTTESPSDDGINWAEYVVRLNAGFVPIAVKEHAGVLYIISRKQIGNEPDDTVDLIEFGSYPSPEKYTQQEGEYDSKTIELDENSPNILYNPIIINSLMFKPGEYTKFTTTTTDIDYLSSSRTDGDIRFYKLKLLQQLTSGYLDLTNDINTKYETYLEENETYLEENELTGEDHWILDPNFIYPCPLLYKGNLALSLEIEPITKLEVKSLEDVVYNIESGGNTFSVEFSVDIGYTDGTHSMKVDTTESMVISSFVGDEPVGTVTQSVLTTNPQVVSVTISDIPDEYQNEILDITITPNYWWLGWIDGDNDYLPSIYTDQFILQTQIILSSEYSDVEFSLNSDFDNNTCSSSYYGYKVYNELLLTDGNGLSIDNELEVSNDNYVLISRNTTLTPTAGNIVLGTYLVTDYATGEVNASSILWTTDNTEDPNYVSIANRLVIKSALDATIITVEDSSCLSVDLTIRISGNGDSNVTVIQPNTDISYSDTGKTLTFSVNPGFTTNVTIDPIDDSLKSITDSFAITEDTIFDYGLISDVETISTYSGNVIALDTAVTVLDGTTATVTVGNTTTGLTEYYRGSFVMDATTLSRNVNIFQYTDVDFGSGWVHLPGKLFSDNQRISYLELTSGDTLETAYRNISDPSYYKLINSSIIRTESVM